MWSIFTYAYNTILVAFIALHLLVGSLISFLAGLYLGVYLTQNYNVPRITEPTKLWDKMLLFMEKHRLRSLVRPSNVLSLVREMEDEQPPPPPVIQASLQLHPDSPVSKMGSSSPLLFSSHLD